MSWLKLKDGRRVATLLGWCRGCNRRLRVPNLGEKFYCAKCRNKGFGTKAPRDGYPASTCGQLVY